MADLKGLRVEAIVLGVSIDQLGSFAIGAALAVLAGVSASDDTPRQSLLTAAQNLYEVLCIALGVISAGVGARVAGRSMIVHGLAISTASLVVSSAIGLAAGQPMFDARGMLFQMLALLAGPLGGWLASLWPARRDSNPRLQDSRS
jgi:hypothetical protein